MKVMKEFFGGWCMCIVFVVVLFMMLDLLLLDESTNYLDVYVLTWFEEFLWKWEKMVFIVLYDCGFLNDCMMVIIFLYYKKLCYYGGFYDIFFKVRVEYRVNEEAM